MAFLAGLDAGGAGIFTGAGGATTTIFEINGPTFFLLDDPSINSAGTVAFFSLLDTGGEGIYLGDGGAGTKVIGTGDALFGSTVEALNFGPQALNDAGQLAFRVYLADGREGIAVATPVPEPATAGLLALGALGWLGRRRR